MTLVARIALLLGAVAVLKRPVERELDLDEIIRNGIPAAAVDLLAKEARITSTELQQIININPSTYRRRVRSQAKLKADESDRVVRFARVAAIANEGPGDGAIAAAWLHEPNRVLANRVPLDLLATDVETRQVEDVLGRIEYGVSN